MSTKKRLALRRIRRRGYKTWRNLKRAIKRGEAMEVFR